jgi:chemotaxis protein methyltransferase CheR
MPSNETCFYRDGTPFRNFSDVIMPALIAARADERRIRIWCAAASTGQEPYSVAMSIKDARALVGWRVEILATDLCGEALERARAGRYSKFEVQRGLPIRHLIKYFEQCDDLWQISPEIRTMVRFRQFNLLDDFAPLGTFDVVICRNVLVHFDQPTRSEVLRRIACIIPPDGYLVLGADETVIGLTEAFRPMTDRRGVQLFKVARHRAAACTATKPRLTLIAGGRR